MLEYPFKMSYNSEEFHFLDITTVISHSNRRLFHCACVRQLLVELISLLQSKSKNKGYYLFQQADHVMSHVICP